MAQAQLSGYLLCIIPFPEPKEVLDRIRARHPNLKITYQTSTLSDGRESQEHITDETWKDVTVICGLTNFPVPKAAPRLEFIQVVSAGTDHMSNMSIYKDSNVPVATVSGIHGPPIAEWVIMTILVASRKYNLLRERQLLHSWEGTNGGKTTFQSVSDHLGKRFGILGYGSIGRQVARLVNAMGMDVTVFTANARNTPESKRDTGYMIPGTGDPEGSIPSAWFSGHDKASLHNFLQNDLDFLLVSVPLITSTTHLLGREEFEILSKRNAYIINISRGKLLVQDELIDALNEFENDEHGILGKGRKGLRGAALDVTTPEPLPEDHPLWEAPNCIVTPHMSGLSRDYATRALEVLEANLERHSKRQRLVNIVDREAGYATKLSHI